MLEADEAVEAWKLMKKQIKEVAKVQAARLEQAMVTGRRWTPGDFESLLVRHPLMIHLVRLALWGCYDKAGKLVSTFRVTDERDFADARDKPLKLGRLDVDRGRPPAPPGLGRRLGLGRGLRRLRDHPPLPPARPARPTASNRAT